MKKKMMNGLSIAKFCFLAYSGQVVSIEPNPSKAAEETSFQRKEDVIRIDQNESTDTFAIPFDDSAFEDDQYLKAEEKAGILPKNSASELRR